MRHVLGLLIALSPPAAGAGVDIDTRCLDCHQPMSSRGEVPIIEGQHREYLEHQLSRFRDRHRVSFPMSALVGGAGDASLQQIAEALSLRAWPGLSMPIDAAAAERGAEAARRRDCAGCHESTFEGAGDIPRLAGQHPGYLARQLEAIGRGERFHPPSGTGAPMRAIDPTEAQALAAHFGRLRPTPDPQE